MANSADPDHLSSSKAKWSGSTLFAKAGYIQVQQDKGYDAEWKYWNSVCSKLTLKAPITTIVVCFVFCLWF